MGRLKSLDRKGHSQLETAGACMATNHDRGRGVGNELTRREMLRVGSLAPLGLGLLDVLASEATAAPVRQAKSVILLFMWGGPSHLDTWDPKPNAPAEIRGPFQSIATTVPGLRISEHFPRLAARAEHYAVVRSMTHTDPAHLSPVHHLMTGRVAPKPNSDNDGASRSDAPCLGAMVQRMLPSADALPRSVTLPWAVSHPSAPGGVAPGQNGGWLGSAFDPFLVTGDPNSPTFVVTESQGAQLARGASRLHGIRLVERARCDSRPLWSPSIRPELLAGAAVDRSGNALGDWTDSFRRHVHRPVAWAGGAVSNS